MSAWEKQVGDDGKTVYSITFSAPKWAESLWKLKKRKN